MVKMEDEDELDNLLNQLNSNPITVVEEAKAPAVIDEIEEDEILRRGLKEVEDDRELAKKAFDLFYPNLAMGQDKSQGSKESLMKAIELRILAGKTTVELLKAKNSKQKEQSGNVGIFINQNKSGIDIQNIRNNLED
jgi:hypothetical protein